MNCMRRSDSKPLTMKENASDGVGFIEIPVHTKLPRGRAGSVVNFTCIFSLFLKPWKKVEALA